MDGLEVGWREGLQMKNNKEEILQVSYILGVLISQVKVIRFKGSWGYEEFNQILKIIRYRGVWLNKISRIFVRFDKYRGVMNFMFSWEKVNKGLIKWWFKRGFVIVLKKEGGRVIKVVSII